jgi:Tfp pilus assembly protein PilE
MQYLRHSRPDSRRRIAGFTVVELAIVITIVPLLTMVFIMMLYTSVLESRRTSAQAVYDSRSQVAMDWIEHDIRYATSFAEAVDQTKYPSDTNNYSPGVQFAYTGQPTPNASARSLILTLPATTGHQLSSSRNLIYLSSPNGCSTPSYNPPLLYTAVFFVKNSVLYKRTIPDTASTTCGGTVYQKLSCPRSVAGCQVRDEIVAANVSQFMIDYYDASGSTTPLDVYNDSSLLATAVAANVTLTLTQQSVAKPAVSTITLKTTRAN